MNWDQQFKKKKIITTSRVSALPDHEYECKLSERKHLLCKLIAAQLLFVFVFFNTRVEKVLPTGGDYLHRPRVFGHQSLVGSPQAGHPAAWTGAIQERTEIPNKNGRSSAKETAQTQVYHESAPSAGRQHDSNQAP